LDKRGKADKVIKQAQQSSARSQRRKNKKELKCRMENGATKMRFEQQ
jgi:hypothetical protein